MKQNDEIFIQPNHRAINLNVKELYQYKDLIFLFVQRNFKLIYTQTILGPLWLILNPLLTSVLFTFIFGDLAGMSTDGVPKLLFYMSGNTMWGLFSSAVGETSNTFVRNANVFGKIYFPRLTVPISQTITAFVNFLIQFAMLMIFWVYYWCTGVDLKFTASLLLLPILLLQAMALALGVGIIISSLTTKYRDLTIAVGFGIQLWMYATPIIYPLSSIHGFLHVVLLANPMTAVIHNFKYVLLGTGELLMVPWLISIVVTIALLLVGMIMFNNVEKTFMDTV